MKKIYIIALISILAGLGSLKAQQTPIFSQYYVDPFLYNPAVAGDSNYTNAYALYRNQWTGIPGAPQTAIFTIDGAVKPDKVGLGLSIYNDQAGMIDRTGAYGTYAYHVKLAENQRLSFGLSVGFDQNKIDFSQVKTDDLNDPTLLSNIATATSFNGNAGIKYSYGNFGLGVASYQLLQSSMNYASSYDSKSVDYTLNRQYMASAQYRFAIKPDELYIDPLVMVHYAQGSGYEAELHLMVNYKNLYWGGLAYRQDFGLSITAAAFIYDKITVGYAYDLSFGDISRYTNGSHEIVVGYRFMDAKRALRRNPAYKEDMGKMDQKIDGQGKKIDSLDKNVDSLDKNVDAIKKDNQKQSDAIKKQDTILSKHTKDIDRLGKDNDSLKKTMEEINSTDNKGKTKKANGKNAKTTDGSSNGNTDNTAIDESVTKKGRRKGAKDANGNDNNGSVSAATSGNASSSGTEDGSAGSSGSVRHVRTAKDNADIAKIKKSGATVEEITNEMAKSRTDIQAIDSTPNSKYNYYAVVGSFKGQRHAKQYQKLMEKIYGVDTKVIKSDDGLYYHIYTATVKTKTEAINELRKIDKSGAREIITGNPWICAGIKH